MDGLGEGLRDWAAVAVEKCAGEVLAGFYVGRVGGSSQCGGHLFGDLGEGGSHDFELDGVDAGASVLLGISGHGVVPVLLIHRLAAL